MDLYQFLAFLIAIFMVVPIIFAIVCLLTIHSITQDTSTPTLQMPLPPRIAREFSLINKSSP